MPRFDHHRLSQLVHRPRRRFEVAAVLLLILVAVGATALAVTSRLSAGSLASADYREGLVPHTRPLSLNPYVRADDPAVRDIGHLLYRGMTRLDDRALPVPDLAESITVSSDGLTYHAVLHQGLQWSDGSPLTAADVIATVAFVQSSSVTDMTRHNAWQGVQARVGAAAASVDFMLPTPRGSFMATLADLPVLPIGSVNDVKQLVNAAATPMPTSGAYRVTVTGSDAIRLEPNAHAITQPRLHIIVFRLFDDYSQAVQALGNGDVDGLVAATPGERTLTATTAGVSRHAITTFRFVDLLFNERSLGLDDPAVRRAIAGIVDRKQIVDAAVGGSAVAQGTAVPAGIVWAQPSASALMPNAAAAAAALDGAGWRLGADGVRTKSGARLTLSLTTPAIAPLPDVAKTVAHQLLGLGIAVTVTPISDSDFTATALAGHHFDLALADWDNGPDPDISTYWRSSAVPPQGFNVSGGAVDAFLDQDLDSLATLTDVTARQQAAAQVATQLDDDLPAVFLYAPTVTLVVSNRIAHVAVPATGGSAARFDLMPSWGRG